MLWKYQYNFLSGTPSPGTPTYIVILQLIELKQIGIVLIFCLRTVYSVKMI